MKALEGFKVLEWCHSVAGAYCGKLLADLGADLIKVEKPLVGDEARRRGPFLHDQPHPERSGLFLYLNTNKLGITLNIEHPRGRMTFRELIKGVDSLVEDNPPHLMEELGLSYKTLKEINPRLIMVSITPFGHTGSYKDYKAYPLNCCHGGGEGYLLVGGRRNLDRPPVKTGGFATEYECGIFAGVATLVALYSTGRTGMGQHIDISKQECVMHMNKPYIARYGNEGVVESRATQGPAAGNVTEACQDGWVQLLVTEEHHWQALADLMGNPSWTQEEWCQTAFGRTQHRREFNQRIKEWVRGQTKEEFYHKGQAKGIATAIVATAKDVVNSEQMKARQFFVQIDHPRAGKLNYPSAPYKFSKTPWKVRRSAPLLGEHNEDVYCQRFGYSREELVKLRQYGVI